MNNKTIKYFDGTEETINMGDVSIENSDIDKFKIYKFRNRKDEDVEKNNSMFSVGFYNSDFTEEKKDGKYYRIIKQATLYEVSLASFPATLKGTFFGIKSKLENFVLKLINKLF
jgi:hypothetical protein